MIPATPPPKWNDPKLKLGTRIRSALWLLSEVGVGNLFTKAAHRAAFPGVTQADRRIRELRKDGWVIHTSADDASLNTDEQRLVRVGARVWERGAGRSHGAAAPSAKCRRAALAASNYQCTICGIAAGESYPDAPHATAILAVSRRSRIAADGNPALQLAVECKQCMAGYSTLHGNSSGLEAIVAALSPLQRKLFADWAKMGGRGELDRAWAEFRRLPPEVQLRFLASLKE
jgi:hypothetical protein